MNEKELNVNNSKKLIIGVSILFCAVILIIGTTTAFFSQGASDVTGNIVSSDELSLEYNDDENNYMRQGLIPSSRENAIYAYNREENKCKDDYGYSACSIYRFSIKNTANVAQDLQLSLHPTANSYTNLKFILYEVTDEGNVLLQNTTDLIKSNVTPINLYKTYTLDRNSTKTFELLYYIEAKGYDQTSEDAGKQFGAGIRIDSLTTGSYTSKITGDSCWEFDKMDKTKLVKFNGIIMDAEDGQEINASCGDYITKEGSYYNIIVPSTVGGQEVYSLGNKLFNSLDGFGDDGPIFNKYINIKHIIVGNEIKEIDDGNEDEYLGTFAVIGFENDDPNYNFTVQLPNSLKVIGNSAFLLSSLSSVTIPKSVEIIGKSAFRETEKLTTLTFEGAEDGTSNLHTIEDSAFLGSELTYTDRANPLKLPSTIIKIGSHAFRMYSPLNFIYFPGSTEGFGDGWSGQAEVLTKLESNG